MRHTQGEECAWNSMRVAQDKYCIDARLLHTGHKTRGGSDGFWAVRQQQMLGVRTQQQHVAGQLHARW
jgi:hypothetical protein